MNIIFHVKITSVKNTLTEMSKKTIFDHIFVGREKEKMEKKDSGERDR